jgi:hypothetical protein
MPLKGYHRVGGPNATLTELGFGGSGGDLIPIAGTFLRGPVDTSRNENDFLGNPFYMPYSTTYYADGLGGEYGTETWGLQYLPAGWVTGTGTVQHSIYITEADYNAPAGDDLTYYIEDGTGINYQSGLQGALSRPNNGDVICGPIGEPYSAFSSYFDGFSNETVTVDSGLLVQDYAIYDNTVVAEYSITRYIVSGNYYPDGTFVADQPDSSPEVPSGSGNTFFDGNDNRTEWDGNGNTIFRYSGLYTHGTFIYDYDNNHWYWDGAGGWYSESIDYGYPPYGTELVAAQSGNYTISTNCGEMIVGDWYDDADYADGNGGYYNDGTSYYNYYSNGTQVGNCNLNNYFADGSGGYYTEPDGTGDGGGGGGDNCESPSDHEDGIDGWSYDGCHWSWTDPNSGGGCPSYGSYISGPTFADSFLNTDCGDFYLGSYIYSTYEDGNCSSYDSIETAFPVPYGAYVGSCYENNYFADGNGGSFIL